MTAYSSLSTNFDVIIFYQHQLLMHSSERYTVVYKIDDPKITIRKEDNDLLYITAYRQIYITNLLI